MLTDIYCLLKHFWDDIVYLYSFWNLLALFDYIGKEWNLHSKNI